MKNLFKDFISWITEPWRSWKAENARQKQQDELRVKFLNINLKTGDIEPYENEA